MWQRVMTSEADMWSSHPKRRTEGLAGAQVWVVALGLSVLGGCNLGVDVDQYPYVTIIQEEDLGEDLRDMKPAPDMAPQPDLAVDMPAEDMTPDLPPDMKPTFRGPRLIFTEVMISTTKRGATNEFGEYIEIANIGDEPASLSNVEIRLDTSSATTLKIKLSPTPELKEQQQFDALETIKPGEHFVFVRDDDEDYGITTMLELGYFFEWHYSQAGVGLSNTTRKLTLFYSKNQGLFTQDEISWASGNLEDQKTKEKDPDLGVTENVAFVLDYRAYTDEDNDETKNWCLATELIDAKDQLRGSPGRVSTCPPR